MDNKKCSMVIFSLNDDPHFNLKQHFDSPDKAYINSWYIYPRPKAESNCADCLWKGIDNIYEL